MTGTHAPAYLDDETRVMLGMRALKPLALRLIALLKGGEILSAADMVRRDASWTYDEYAWAFYRAAYADFASDSWRPTPRHAYKVQELCYRYKEQPC